MFWWILWRVSGSVGRISFASQFFFFLTLKSCWHHICWVCAKQTCFLHLKICRPEHLQSHYNALLSHIWPFYLLSAIKWMDTILIINESIWLILEEKGQISLIPASCMRIFAGFFTPLLQLSVGCGQNRTSEDFISWKQWSTFYIIFWLFIDKATYCCWWK